MVPKLHRSFRPYAGRMAEAYKTPYLACAWVADKTPYLACAWEGARDGLSVHAVQSRASSTSARGVFKVACLSAVHTKDRISFCRPSGCTTMRAFAKRGRH